MASRPRFGGFVAVIVLGLLVVGFGLYINSAWLVLAALIAVLFDLLYFGVVVPLYAIRDELQSRSGESV